LLFKLKSIRRAGKRIVYRPGNMSLASVIFVKGKRKLKVVDSLDDDFICPACCCGICIQMKDTFK